HIECSGAGAALTSGIAAVRPTGTIVQVGLGDGLAAPLQLITSKEIALKGSFRFHEEFRTAVALMQKRLIDVAPLITHTMPIDDAPAAFLLASDRGQAMKVQIAF